jgi:hypothetical protein
MSISWKPTQTINTPLSKEVIQQFDTRREILSKTNSITDDELKFLHSNTGWIKVSSGVDELIKEGSDQQPSINSLAKENILFGGTFDADKGIKQGILSDNSSYNFSEQYGYRPMAGITSFSIVNLDTHGAIRKATIDFSVNSLEDLTKFEKLYLRPGFTVMLEFGHSISLKLPYDNGPYYFQNIVDYYDNFFDNIDIKAPTVTRKENESEEDYQNRKIQAKNNSRLNQIESEIKKLRKDSGYNYDAMFGRISNFNWTYNVDTTYNCSFDVMGYGSVIESLSALSSETIAGSEKESSDANTSIGNKFNSILDFGVETDPFLDIQVTTENEDFIGPRNQTTSDTETPDRNARIAAVTHFACEDDSEGNIRYSKEEDGQFDKEELDGIKYLQVGDVFEFVNTNKDKRYNKAIQNYESSENYNFVIVNVNKGDEVVRGYKKTVLFGGFTNTLNIESNNQPSQQPSFPFIALKIENDNKIKKIGRISITEESKKYLNETYGTNTAAPVTGNTAPVEEEKAIDLSKFTEKQAPVVKDLIAKGYKQYNGSALPNMKTQDKDQGLVAFTKPVTLGRTNVVRILSNGKSTDYNVTEEVK